MPATLTCGITWCRGLLLALLLAFPWDHFGPGVSSLGDIYMVDLMDEDGWKGRAVLALSRGMAWGGVGYGCTHLAGEL